MFVDLRRIKTVKKDCTTIKCTKRWVGVHLPSLIHPPSRKRVRPSYTVSSTTSAEMCRDVCLYSNTDLSIVQENVAESERASLSGVCEAADTLEVTVTFQTADDRQSEVEKTGTGTPRSEQSFRQPFLFESYRI